MFLYGTCFYSANKDDLLMNFVVFLWLSEKLLPFLKTWNLNHLASISCSVALVSQFLSHCDPFIKTSLVCLHARGFQIISRKKSKVSTQKRQKLFRHLNASCTKRLVCCSVRMRSMPSHVNFYRNAAISCCFLLCSFILFLGINTSAKNDPSLMQI